MPHGPSYRAYPRLYQNVVCRLAAFGELLPWEEGHLLAKARNLFSLPAYGHSGGLARAIGI